MIKDEIYNRSFTGTQNSIFTVFIYSMPGYSIPIKERMLYSSCKAPLLSTLEDSYEIKLDRKVSARVKAMLRMRERKICQRILLCVNSSHFGN